MDAPRGFDNVLDRCLAVRSGEQVMLLTDEGTDADVVAGLVAGIEDRSAVAIVSRIPVPPLPGSEPPSTVAAAMREAGAVIELTSLFIGSSAGCIGEAFHHDYAAAKSAVMFGLIRSLKVEIVDFADHGRVNAVSPGWCATPMSESALRDAKVLNRITSTIPLRKVATPRDVAAAAIFLASDVLAGHVTGEILSVTGGMDGRLLYGELL